MGREPCTLPITSRRLCTRPGSYAAELIRGQACTRLGSHANEIITGRFRTLPGSYAPGLVRGRLRMVRGFAWYAAELVRGRAHTRPSWLGKRPNKAELVRGRVVVLLRHDRIGVVLLRRDRAGVVLLRHALRARTRPGSYVAWLVHGRTLRHDRNTTPA